MSTTRPQKPNAYRTMFRAVVLYLLLPVVLLLTAVLTWLRWESSQPREDWFDARQGRIEDIRNEHVALDGEQLSEAVRLVADTGLAADFRAPRADDGRFQGIVCAGISFDQQELELRQRST